MLLPAACLDAPEFDSLLPRGSELLTLSFDGCNRLVAVGAAAAEAASGFGWDEISAAASDERGGTGLGAGGSAALAAADLASSSLPATAQCILFITLCSNGQKCFGPCMRLQVPEVGKDHTTVHPLMQLASA